MRYNKHNSKNTNWLMINLDDLPPNNKLVFIVGIFTAVYSHVFILGDIWWKVVVNSFYTLAMGGSGMFVYTLCKRWANYFFDETKPSIVKYFSSLLKKKIKK